MNCANCKSSCVESQRIVEYYGQNFCSKSCVGAAYRMDWLWLGGPSIVVKEKHIYRHPMFALGGSLR